MKIISIEIDGVKYEPVKDDPQDPFYGCKDCDLCDICRPSEMYCEDLRVTDSHFKRVADEKIH